MPTPRRTDRDDNSGLFIGLMSGTSVDAIDVALVDCAGAQMRLVATREHPFPPGMREDIQLISQPGDNEIERLGILDRRLGALFAEATLQLLRENGLEPHDVTAIGSHGQTIRHRPPSAGADQLHSYTLQIGDPNTIAEVTGITTVADFRRRDIAAAGEGAPLAPAFHAAAFARPGSNRAIVNIGGIANVTLLEGTTLVAGFDCGPGNTLLDHWYARHRKGAFDRDGAWAASGEVIPALLEELLGAPYFARTGPRSTGKETFNLPWLDRCLSRFGAARPADVQATLSALTVTGIERAIACGPVAVDEVYICGGGARNTFLMSALAQALAPGSCGTTAELGVDPEWVEAAAFAWLAARRLRGLTGNAPAVTGAAGGRVLGAIYPGGG